MKYTWSPRSVFTAPIVAVAVFKTIIDSDVMCHVTNVTPYSVVEHGLYTQTHPFSCETTYNIVDFLIVGRIPDIYLSIYLFTYLSIYLPHI